MGIKEREPEEQGVLILKDRPRKLGHKNWIQTNLKVYKNVNLDYFLNELYSHKSPNTCLMNERTLGA